MLDVFWNLLWNIVRGLWNIIRYLTRAVIMSADDAYERRRAERDERHE